MTIIYTGKVVTTTVTVTVTCVCSSVLFCLADIVIVIAITITIRVNILWTPAVTVIIFLTGQRAISTIYVTDTYIRAILPS
jgi:hypothetical protein